MMDKQLMDSLLARLTDEEKEQAYKDLLAKLGDDKEQWFDSLLAMLDNAEKKQYFTKLFAHFELDEQSELLRTLNTLDGKDKRMDVRALVLCKSTLQNLNFLDCFAKDDQDDHGKKRKDYCSYAALGSLGDSIQTFQLEVPPDHDDLLDVVFRENNSLSNQLDGSVFAIPQYVVYYYKDDSQEDKHLKNFWKDEENDNFFFVTTYNLLNPVVSFEERMRIRQELNSRIYWYRDKQCETYRYLVYESLDLLSDFIVLWKSKTVRPVLDALHHCYCFANSTLGHTRTVCAVDSSKLLDEGKFKKLQKLIGPSSGKHASIDSMTVRAVSNDYNALIGVKENLSSLEEKNVYRSDQKGQHSFVLGNTDYIGFFNGLDDQILCEYLQQLLLLIGNQNDHLSGAVIRIETSIGIDEQGNQGVSRKDVSKAAKQLRTATGWLLEKMNQFFRKTDVFNDVCAPWKPLVLELSNQLRHMSESCVYDSVCFLLLDSLYLFQQWLEQKPYHAATKEKNIDKARAYLLKQAININDYVHGWMQLTDIVARSIGVVTHMPGYSPALYHMSTSILEFCHGFFTKTAAFLRKTGDGRKELYDKCHDDIACILIPTQCRRIKTFEDFEEGIDDSRLVYIEVPLELLSDPLKIVTMLTHEAGHRYGLDALCLREERWERYANALAFYVAAELKRANDIDFIVSLACPCTKGKDHRIPATKDSCVSHIKNKLAEKKISLGTLPLDKTAEWLAELFKESYADLVMIKLLGCDFETYFENLFLHLPECERYRLGIATEDTPYGYDSDSMGREAPANEEKAKQIILDRQAAVITTWARRLFTVCKVAYANESQDWWDEKWKAVIAKAVEDKENDPRKDPLLARLPDYIQAIQNEYQALFESHGVKMEAIPLAVDQCIIYLRACGEALDDKFGSDEDKNADEREKAERKKIADERKSIQQFYQDVKGKNCFFQKPYYELVRQSRQRVLDHIQDNGESIGTFYFGNACV